MLQEVALVELARVPLGEGLEPVKAHLEEALEEQVKEALEEGLEA